MDISEKVGPQRPKPQIPLPRINVLHYWQDVAPPVLRPEGAPLNVVQGAQGGLHLLAPRLPPARQRAPAPDARGEV